MTESYVTITGTLKDPIDKTDQHFPKTTITITSSQFGFYNQLPITRVIKLVQSGNYNFKLLKGSNYEITIESQPQSGTTGKRNNVTFNLEIPDIVDDTVEYDLFSFSVTNFSPLLQQNDITYARFLENNSPYYLRIENENLVVRDLSYTRQKTVSQMFPRGGLLNNNSFEYNLIDEDYTFNTLTLSNGADVNVTYNGDVPFDVVSNDNEYSILEGSRSLSLEIMDSGSSIDDIVLPQKLLPRVLIPNQNMILRGYFKLVSGTPLSDIELSVDNTNGNLITFDNVSFDEDNNGWYYYASIITVTDDEFLLNSSQEIFFNVKMGGIGNSLVIRIDEFQLNEYYNN